MHKFSTPSDMVEACYNNGFKSVGVSCCQLWIWSLFGFDVWWFMPILLGRFSPGSCQNVNAKIWTFDIFLNSLISIYFIFKLLTFLTTSPLLCPFTWDHYPGESGPFSQALVFCFVLFFKQTVAGCKASLEHDATTTIFHCRDGVV